ncbi:barstar family protein [Streptomyces viridochromogenes]|uniref:barstar family protein n=1 Tax=Streptomyces viridochromogenes TaxID=1938 RepID=UPI00069F7FC2|nr:barstar family protein [Streptomyces viridochromogenes]
MLRPPAEAAADVPAGAEVRVCRCRTGQDLFTERAAVLGFPDYFGRNWDAFRDCFQDAVSRADPGAVSSAGEATAPPTVVVREGGGLLADEP